MPQSRWIPFGARTGPFVPVLPPTVGTSLALSGLGPPEGATPGVPGQTYTDTASNLGYLKMAGTQEAGWKLIGPAIMAQLVGGSGQQQAFAGPGSPVGVLTPTASVALWFQTDSVPPNQITAIWYGNAWH